MASSLGKRPREKGDQASALASRITTGSGQNSTRIVIADADSFFRYGLRRLLESEPDFRLIAEVEDSAKAVRLARQLKPDLVLLGLPLSGRAGVEVLRDLVMASSTVRIVVLTSSVEKSVIVEALQLGAHGVVQKGSSPRVLMESIRRVIDGQYWLGPEGLAFIVDALRELAPRGSGAHSLKDYGLTPRESALITRVVAGLSNRDLGREFSISERTVKHHLTNIYEKLGISSRLELAVFTLNHHLSAPG